MMLMTMLVNTIVRVAVVVVVVVVRRSPEAALCQSGRTNMGYNRGPCRDSSRDSNITITIYRLGGNVGGG